MNDLEKKRMKRKVRFKVYSVENKNEKAPDGASNFDGELCHKVIVFVCKNQKLQKEIL